jgi:hypothetical protein
MKPFFLIFFFFTAFSVTAFGQELTKINETVFKPGEELSYRLKYGFFTAATADIKVENSAIKFDDRPAYHIIAEGRTAGTFDFLYKVRNRYETYIDEKTLLPYFYAEDMSQTTSIQIRLHSITLMIKLRLLKALSLLKEMFSIFFRLIILREISMYQKCA